MGPSGVSRLSFLLGALVLAACGPESAAPVAAPPVAEPSTPAVPPPERTSLPGETVGYSSGTVGLAPLPDRIDQTRPLGVVVRYRDIPPGSGLVVHVLRDGPIDPMGVVGPLMLAPEPIEGSGEHRIEWDARSVGCAPTDLPEWCGLRNGNYRFQVSVYNRDNFGLVGWPDRSPKTLLVEWRGEPFRVAASEDYADTALALSEVARRKLFDQLWKDGQQRWGYANPQGHFRDDGRLVRRVGLVCMTFTAQPPLTGALTACNRAGKTATFSGGGLVTGSVRYRPGAMTFKAARERAFALVSGPYRPANLIIDKTWNHRNWTLRVGEARYFPRENSWALTVFFTRPKEGDAHGVERSPAFLVRVPPAAPACLVSTAPIPGSPQRALRSEAVACPAKRDGG